MSAPMYAACTAPEPCDFELAVWSPEDKQKREEVHAQRRHGIDPPAREPLPQLPKVAFETAFFAAVKDLPIGWTGTTADLHSLVAPPQDHHWWGSATKAAGHMGYLKQIDTQKSELSTANGSLVHTWERVDERARRSA